MQKTSCARATDGSFRQLQESFRNPPREYGIYPIMHGLCYLAAKSPGKRQAAAEIIAPEKAGARPAAVLLGAGRGFHLSEPSDIFFGGGAYTVDPTGKLLAKAVAQLVRCGFGGVVTNPGWGTDYLKDLGPLKQVVRALEQADLPIYLYDERVFPTGSAGGLVLDAHPELENEVLMGFRHPLLLCGPGEYRVDVPNGKLFRAFLLPAVERRSDSPVELAGRVDLTDTVDSRGRLWVQIPRGQWILVMLFARKQYDATHSLLGVAEPRRAINLLDRRAGDAFVRITYDRFFKAVGKSFGRSIKAIFMDEPSLQLPPAFGRNQFYVLLPWRDGLPEAFRRKFGREIDEAVLASFVADAGPRSAALRCDFWELIADEVVSGFFEPVADWCEQHRVAATGHFLWEERVANHPGFLGSHFAAMRRMQTPGIDMLTTLPESLMKECIVPKFSASVAHLARRKEVMTEASNYFESGMESGVNRKTNLAEYRASMNWHFALGVNVITSYYDFVGFSDADLRSLNTHVARLGTMLRLGEHTAPVAVLYPEQSLWAGTIGGLPSNELMQLDAACKDVTNALLASQTDFDFIDERALRTSSCRDGQLKLGDRDYSALILPRATLLDQPLARAILRFADADSLVIAVGALPCQARERGLDRNVLQEFQRRVRSGKIRFLPAVNTTFVRLTGRLSEVAASPASTHLLVHHRRDSSREIYFVVNMARKPYRGTLALCGSGRCTEWNPEDGKSRPAAVASTLGGRTKVRAVIPALKARFFSLE